MIIKDSRFIKSASSLKDLPTDGLPEFAFIGRSNVGKSSLMNMLLGRKNLVKTSKKPGKTVLLNYFLVNDSFYFVDLPGYGFARRSKADREAWRRLIELYLVERKELKDVFLLIDSRHGVLENDEDMIDFLDHHGIDFTPVFTKVDKVPKNTGRMIKNKNPESPVVSAVTGTGKEEFLDFISNHLSDRSVSGEVK
ncbi:MAG TPA: YihA family ribosome biogenesis GTP-binding protein [bacterium]|nr:YihA family ribosome biogenesis GTP-binding protein [bacterium]